MRAWWHCSTVTLTKAMPTFAMLVFLHIIAMASNNNRILALSNIHLYPPQLLAVLDKACIGVDRDVLKEKTEVFQTFFPSNWACLSLSHTHWTVTQTEWQQRRTRWHFLTFKTHLLISTNCTISLILLLTSLAIRKKTRKAEIQCILLLMGYYKHRPVLRATTMCLQKEGKVPGLLFAFSSHWRQEGWKYLTSDNVHTLKNWIYWLDQTIQIPSLSGNHYYQFFHYKLHPQAVSFSHRALRGMLHSQVKRPGFNYSSKPRLVRSIYYQFWYQDQ